MLIQHAYQKLFLYLNLLNFKSELAVKLFKRDYLTKISKDLILIFGSSVIGDRIGICVYGHIYTFIGAK